MKGKTVIITGGTRGIGKAAALKLASLEANLVINYLGNDKAASETEEACKQLGAEILLIKGDVASAEQCEKIAAAALERFGRIDVLINNAGITRDGLLMRMEEKDFDSVINTNLKGTFLMTKAVSRQMLKQRYGRIINMASVVGITGNQGQANYSASKAGVIGLTKSFALEVAAKGITVNALAPGFIETDMTDAMTDAAIEAAKALIPAKRMGSPEDVAEVIAFLASEQSGYITGQTVCVDGGMCMR
jgi:3-oxoacyl-[acyl-carrier protein] reductase